MVSAGGRLPQLFGNDMALAAEGSGHGYHYWGTSHCECSSTTARRQDLSSRSQLKAPSSRTGVVYGEDDGASFAISSWAVDGVREEFRLLKPSWESLMQKRSSHHCNDVPHAEPCILGFFILGGCAVSKVVIGYIATALETTVK
jgi:hypothetical protein